MTNRLVDDRDAVAALAQQLADQTGIPASHIEKDFWVTEVLRGAISAATADNIEIVFKGGTSLSKAFGLIHRFSEDVDILVVLPGSIGTGAADTKLKALVRGADVTTGLTAEPWCKPLMLELGWLGCDWVVVVVVCLVGCA